MILEVQGKLSSFFEILFHKKIVFYIRCSGGDPYTAFLYAVTSGITDSSKYKYTSRDGTCRKGESTYYLQNACKLDVMGNENTLKLLLNKIGPMAVAICKFRTNCW